jgi:hypothetical protein
MMADKLRTFFVSYAHSSGFGHTVLDFKKIDKNFIGDTAKYIQDKNNFKKVVILNWKELPEFGEVE